VGLAYAAGYDVRLLCEGWVVLRSEFWRIRLRKGCYWGPRLRGGLRCSLALRTLGDAAVRILANPATWWLLWFFGAETLSHFYPTNSCARAKISSPRSPWQKLRTRFIHSVSSWNAAAPFSRVKESLGDSPQDCT